MVVRFVVEGAALEMSSSDTALNRANHFRLMDLWVKHGIFVQNGDSPALANAIQKMKPDIRKLWQLALTSERFRRVEEKLGVEETLFSDESKILCLRENAEVAYVEESTLGCICAEAEFSKQYPTEKFEVCRLDCCDNSYAIRGYKEMWEKVIPIGTSRDEVWNSRFHGLTTYCKRISIIDRYAGMETIDRFSDGRLSGLLQFIRLINASEIRGKPKSLSIYTSHSSLDCQELISILQKELTVNKKNLAGLILFTADNHDFARISHDRFIRFDSLVTSLGRGTSIFEDSYCSHNFSCALQLDDGTFKKSLEDSLRSRSTISTLL